MIGLLVLGHLTIGVVWAQSSPTCFTSLGLISSPLQQTYPLPLIPIGRYSVEGCG